MDNRTAYSKGWDASRRTVSCDLDAAEERFEAKYGAKYVSSFIDGWHDHASDAPKWSTLKLEAGPVGDTPVTALQSGCTYRFDSESIGSSGRVTVLDVEYSDRVIFVTGFWHHDGGNAPIMAGCGSFDLDDMVSDVSDTDPVVVDGADGRTYTATWRAVTGDRFETAPCSTPSDAVNQARLFLYLYDTPAPDADGIRVSSVRFDADDPPEVDC